MPVTAQPENVAVRQVSEAAGAQVTWNQQEQTLTVIQDARYLRMTAGSEVAMEGILQGGSQDGKTLQTDWYQMESALTVQDGVSYAPEQVLTDFLHLDAPQQADGWIYYSSWSDGGALYRMDSNGRNRKKLSSRDCHDIFYHDGWVYFSPWDENGAVYRVTPDGNGEECVLPENSILQARSGNTLYFLKRELSLVYPYAGKLYGLSLDTKQEFLILDEIIRNPRYYNGYFYYDFSIPEIEMDRRIYRVKADGTERVCLTPGEAYPYLGFYIFQNSIYFTNDTFQLYRMDMDGENLQKTGESRVFVDIYASVEDTLLYRDMDNNWAIYAMDLNGGNKRLLADHGQQLSIASAAFDRVYYFERGEGNATYCVSLDGTGRRKIADIQMYMHPYGDYMLFYPADYEQRYRGVFICDPDGVNQRQLTALPLESIQTSDNWVYFTDQNSYFIHRVNLQGAQETITKEDVRFWTFIPNEKTAGE